MLEKNKMNYLIYVLLFCVVLVGVSSFYLGTHFSEERSIKESKVEENTNKDNNKEVQDNISVKDKYAFTIEQTPTGVNLEFYYLDNGTLYYKIEDNILEYENFSTDDFNNLVTKDLEKYSGVKNIKRIKGCNTTSTGVAFNLLLITKEGKVYELDYNHTSRIFNLIELPYFQDYEVDDILEFESPNGCIDGLECEPSYKAILKNGKTITK